jgi:protein TonB
VGGGAGDFGLYDGVQGTPRRWLGPTGVAILCYAATVAALLALPTRLAPLRERRIDVTFADGLDFVHQVPKPPPPPPPPVIAPPAPVLHAPAPAPVKPPPKPEPPRPKPVPPPKPAPAPAAKPKPVVPAPPAAAAPVVRPEQKVRRLEKPPPPKELRAPREIPRTIPREADPARDKGVAVYGEPGRGDSAGLEGGVARGGVAGGTPGGVVELPAGAEAPRLLPGGKMPEYPAAARAARKSGIVILKLVVFADGTVGDVSVVQGEEPFVSAAVRAVKSWRYQPARLHGRPIAVYREVRIPFKLSG